MSRVLVTGVSGYIAGHVAAEFRAHGYDVRGTARREVEGIDDVVAADLLADDGWDAAVDGCDVVAHVASPFPRGVPKTDDELIRPAVDGTLRVLRAAVANGVSRVVMTSSVAAVSAGHTETRTMTEDDWSVVDRADAYAKSKTLAERAAWEFAREHGLDLVVLNPGMVLGPLLTPTVGTSVQVVHRLMTRDLPASPKMGFAHVDVRDVAVAHRLAAENPAAAGRYILAGEHVWMREIAAVLAERYDRVPTREMPTWLLWIAARFDPSIRQAMSFVGRRALVSAEKAQKELGWSMRPFRDTVFDTAESLIELGIVDGKVRTTV